MTIRCRLESLVATERGLRLDRDWPIGGGWWPLWALRWEQITGWDAIDVQQIDPATSQPVVMYRLLDIQQAGPNQQIYWYGPVEPYEQMVGTIRAKLPDRQVQSYLRYAGGLAYQQQAEQWRAKAARAAHQAKLKWWQRP